MQQRKIKMAELEQDRRVEVWATRVRVLTRGQRKAILDRDSRQAANISDLMLDLLGAMTLEQTRQVLLMLAAQAENGECGTCD